MNIKSIFVAAIILIAVSVIGLQAQDTVKVFVEMPADTVLLEAGASLAATVKIYTNIGLNATTGCYVPNRNIMQLDSIVWSDSMNAMYTNSIAFQTSRVATDTIINANLYSYFFPAFIVNIFGPYPDGPVIEAGPDTFEYATLHMTIKPDSLNVLGDEPVIFCIDSASIPPALDFRFTNYEQAMVSGYCYQYFVLTIIARILIILTRRMLMVMASEMFANLSAGMPMAMAG